MSWFRWFMVGFFTLFSGWIFLQRHRLGQFRESFCKIDVDEPAQTKLDRAFEERLRAEAIPSDRISVAISCASLALAALAALSTISILLLYGLLAVSMATVLGVTYLRFRRIQIRRVAMLALRSQMAVAPSFLWALTATAIVLPLVWSGNDPIASLLVMSAGSGIAYIARRVAVMPAFLNGEDIALEGYIDARLRSARVGHLLALAVGPAYFFEAVMGCADPIQVIAAIKTGAIFIGLAAVLATTGHLFTSMRRQPSASEIATW